MSSLIRSGCLHPVHLVRHQEPSWRGSGNSIGIRGDEGHLEDMLTDKLSRTHMGLQWLKRQELGLPGFASGALHIHYGFLWDSWQWEHVCLWLFGLLLTLFLLLNCPVEHRYDDFYFVFLCLVLSCLAVVSWKPVLSKGEWKGSGYEGGQGVGVEGGGNCCLNILW